MIRTILARPLASLGQLILCALLIVLAYVGSWTACGMSHSCAAHNRAPETYVAIMRAVQP